MSDEASSMWDCTFGTFEPGPWDRIRAFPVHTFRHATDDSYAEMRVAVLGKIVQTVDGEQVTWLMVQEHPPTDSAAFREGGIHLPGVTRYLNAAIWKSTEETQ